MSRSNMILGVKLLGHDLSMAVVDKDGQVVLVAEEERYSRIKGGNFVFYPNLVADILSEFHIDLTSIGFLAVTDMPEFWSHVDDSLLSYSAEARRRHLLQWIQVLHQMLPSSPRISRFRHHYCHAASAFLPSPWEKAAIVTMDAFGDGQVSTISVGDRSNIECVSEEAFPHSIAYMYEALAVWMGLYGRERSGKMMGLAGHGRPSAVGTLKKLLSSSTKKKWMLSKHFMNCKCRKTQWVEVLERLLGPSRNPQEPLRQHHKDIAASFQKIFEVEILRYLKKAHELTGMSRCCYAGGVFLNSAAVGRIIDSGIFSDIFVQPLSSDAGLALGAALSVAQKLGRPRWTMRHAYLGSELDLANVSSIAEKREVDTFQPDDIIEWTAQQLSAGKVLGWCQGRMEVGPRALGNRSVLADARAPEMRHRLNDIKKREKWRPFAPVMLEEETLTFFGSRIRFPFMTAVCEVICPDVIPSAVHIDGTSRLQTVSHKLNPLLSKLLTRFKAVTGVGVLINTSLNLQGQPIARTIGDCLEFLLHSDIDALVAGNYVFRRKVGERSPIIQFESGFEELSFLPSDFVLCAYDSNKPVSRVVQKLGKLAKREVHIPEQAIFSDSHESVLSKLVPAEGETVVVVIPQYFEVWVESLPRIAMQIAKRCNRSDVWVVDALARVRNAKKLTESLISSDLINAPLSDTEIHYKNRFLFGENPE